MNPDLFMLLVLIVGGAFVVTCAGVLVITVKALQFWIEDRRAARQPLSPVVPLEAVRPQTEFERARARRDAGPRPAA